MPARSFVAVNGAWAGLGNRIRFTLSARAIAEVEGREFAYVWPTRPGLFEPSLTDLWAYDAPRLPWGSVVPTMTEHRARLSRRHLLTEVRRARDWAVLGSSVLHLDGREASWESRLPGLTPVPEISDRVGALRATLPERYVGVQVRAATTSHPSTAKASPVTWFVHRMQEQLSQDPHVHFFLSCDEPGTERAIMDAIPNVTTIGDKGAYNSVDGLRAAVADLYLLASSAHILGPYLSSFVELAWLLGGKAQVLENSVHRFEPGSRIHRHMPVADSFRPPPSEVFVRNALMVAYDRVRTGAHSPMHRVQE